MHEINIKDLPAIGSPLPGGFYAGKLNSNGATYAIVVAPKTSGTLQGEWGNYGTRIEGADSYSDGHKNTNAMAAAGSELAKKTMALVIDDLADYYIPSRDELELLYRNLKPSKQENACSFRDGENPSACRLVDRYAYTAAEPAQTTADAFHQGSEQALEAEWHWSSTQYSAYNAWCQDFSNGYQHIHYKGYELAVRAVRRILIIQ